MHIKSLTIQGFKSYKDVVKVDPFSEKVNVCVGRNGAGKSNFFSAIRFVLSDEHTSLNRQERHALLHEGSSATATFSAYVEIVFDNSDNRFPTGKKETILRRTIGAKKDDYSLDRKSTSKAEVMSLLDTAGFSKSNPFFIVPQGRVTALTNQKDPERLELLKDIAGTKVYEDRRMESVRIMEETDAKREKIDELLEYIDERLRELEEEKAELKEYQIAERERRVVEYAIHQKDLEEAKDALAELEEDRANDQAQASQRREEAEERARNIATLESEISSFRERLNLITLEKQQHEADKRDSAKARTQIELLIRDLEDTSERVRGEREDMQRDLETLQDEIEQKETELREVEPRFEETNEKEAECRKELEQAETRQSTLFGKQGRASQFRTQAERDAFLRSESSKATSFLESRQQTLASTKREVAQTQRQLEASRQIEQQISEKLASSKANMGKWVEELDKRKAERDELQEQRKEAWKEDGKLEQTVGYAREELRKAERTLYSMMDRATQDGLKAVDRIAERLGLEGNYGPLYTLFECDERFRTAVEVTAGNSLFHIVVDTDDTAAKILEVMIREKSGRVTFMPLNRLHPKPVEYPQHVDEAIPLISKLPCDERFRPAMLQVFGKTIICEDLRIAAQYGKSHNLTGITLQGDKVDRKGAFTGGYLDMRRSRLQSIKSLKTWQAKHETDRVTQQATKRRLTELDQQISQLVGQIQILESRVRHAQDERGPLVQEAAEVQRDSERAKERLRRLQGAEAELERETSNVQTQVQAYQDELKTTMRDSLSEAEVRELDETTQLVQRKKRDLTQLTKDRSSLASKKELLEIELNQNLRRRKQALEERLEGLNESGDGATAPTPSGTTTLATRRTELTKLQRVIESINKKIDDVEAETEQINTRIAGKIKDLESAQTKQTEDARTTSKQQKNVERYHSKRHILEQRKDECNGHIRELGILPEEAYRRHGERLSSERLYKQLHKANETLKKFVSVNKKAFDQYNEFTKQQRELTQRREELDSSADSIVELIDVLDQRKDEAIERTFKQVSRNFATVFEKLVPQGRGRLIMQSRIGQEEDEDEEEEEASEEEEHDSDEDDDEEEDEDEDDDDDDGPARKRRKSKRTTTRGKKTAAGKKGKGSKSNGKKGKAQAAASKKAKGQASKSKIDSYTGISIKVSFNSKDQDEGLLISQLSGGQKSLVALAMIFAIQKCDPAPFYLFDEIDANLDADRRTAVAAMIRELSDSAQFIITTFRPELLGSADNYLGVVFDSRKISSIKQITQENAYEFVEAAEARR